MLNKLKGIAIIGIIILFHTSCQKEGLVIKCQFDNAENKTILLQEIKVRNVVTIDSITVENNKKIIFNPVIDHPTFFVIKTNEQNMLTLLVNKNEKIVITGDAENLIETAKITGSEGSILLQNVTSALNRTLISIDSLGKIYQQFMNTPKLDSVKKELDSVYNNLINKHHEYILNFVDQNAGSLVCIPALFQQYSSRSYVLNFSQDINSFKKVDSALMTTYANLEQVKSFHRFVIENERKINEQGFNSKVLGIGTIAPNFTLNQPNGDTISLKSLRGKYVLLDFWASWCKPCRLENPNLVKNYKKFHDRNFEIIQVSLDKTKAAWTNAIEKDQLNWIHVSDLQYWNSGPARLYKVKSIPANFLLDKDGKIIASNLRGINLTNKLTELLGDD